MWVGAGTVAVAFLLMLLIPQRGDGPRTASDEEGTLSVETAQDRQRRLQNVEAATRRAERTIHTAWTRADGRVTAEVARRDAAARQRTRPGTPGAGTAEPTEERRSLADQIRAAGDGSADSGPTVRRDGLGRAPLPTGDRLGSLSGAGTSGLSSGSLSGPGADGPTRTGLSSTASRGPSAEHFRPGFDRFVSPAINRCNQRHMGEVGELLTGRVVLQFRIEPDGRVSRLTTSGPASNTPFLRCMTSESTRWRFEPFQGETATIERTYVLR